MNSPYTTERLRGRFVSDGNVICWVEFTDHASELAFTPPKRAAGIYQSAKHLYRTSPNVGTPEQRRIYALRSRAGRGDWQNGA